MTSVSTMIAGDPHSRRCLKGDAARGVWLVSRVDGTERIVKVWPLTALMRVKLALGIAQVQRQIRGQRKIVRTGVSSPAPCGRWRIVRSEPPRIELELEYAPGRTALELLREGETSSLGREVARNLGAMIARLVGQRVFNRDIKLSNIIAAPNGSLSIIDTVGVRAMRDRVSDTERMLERLAIEPFDLELPIPAGIAPRVLRPVLAEVSRAERRAILQRLRQRRRP